MSDTVLKSLIQSVKSKPELSMVTCIYGNRRELSQNPNCSFVLSFETEKVNLSRDKRQDFLFEKSISFLCWRLRVHREKDFRR